jgi:outer membrane protein OmpA-like peptidoglycan-associated protein/Mg-chelatase subunit ChlD
MLFTFIIPNTWTASAETFTVDGPASAHRLTFQEIEAGKLLISVTDAGDNPLMGLTTKDFTIRGGVRTAKIVSVDPLATSKDVGLNIVLVVDNSASMRERKAVEPLLEALEALYGIIRPIDKLSIVVYDDYKTVELDGHKLHAKTLESKDTTVLRAMVKEQMTKRLSGGTYLYDAIMLGLEQMAQWHQESHKFMVVFTDGEDLNSSVDKKILLEKAKEIPNIGAYTVDYMPAKKTNAFLQTLARENNGAIWKARSADELVPIFKSFSSTLLHRYIVSYRFLNAPTGQIVFEPGEVTIEEISTIDSAPLLNYVFFETGQGELSNRYTLLKNQAETEAFSETALTAVMDKYQHILNIIGHRMRKYPDAAITLVGCNSNTGAERGRQDLSRSRAEAVRAYLRYVWGIAADRMAVEARNLPEAPSTNRIPEGQSENQRVEIRSDHLGILDTVKSEYTEKVSSVPHIKVIPNVAAEAGIQEWKITLKCGDTVVGLFKGAGDLEQACTWPVEKDLLDTLVAAGSVQASLQVTDRESKKLLADNIAQLPVKFVRRQEQLAQKQGYKVREKYALILFDYDSAAIKSRNKIIVDRIIERMSAVPQAGVDIIGHTDNIGKEDYNIKLSQRRAEAVQGQFAQVQEPSMSQNMMVSGDGPNNPLYDNGTPEGRALNRTVTIALEYEKQ